MSTLPLSTLTSSTIYRPKDHVIFFNQSKSFVQLSQRPSSFKKTIVSQFIQPKKKNLEEIKSENYRLISKIMEIKGRPRRLKTEPNHHACLKYENYERRRQIQNENKRLGKSLLRIKLGKSQSLLKPQIFKVKLTIYKKKLRRGHTEQNEPDPFSKEYNLFRMQNQEEGIPVRVSKLSKINKLLEI